MVSFNILFCILTFLVTSCWAEVPYDDVKFNIFDKNPRNFEERVFQSMEIVRNFFAREEVQAAVSAGASVLSLIPYVGSIGEVLQMIQSTLAEQSDWRDEFTRTIVDETKREITESEIRWMEATIKTIQDKFILLSEENKDMENRKTVASIIHSDLDKMINFFSLRTSLLKKYPLTGTPPLLQLASIVALFSPVAHTLIPLESKNPQISCKMLDVLVDYRPRTVHERLEKLHSESTLFRNALARVRSKPYNANGYNKSNVMECHSKGCKKPYFSAVAVCLKDDFGDDELYLENYMNPQCWEDYASYVRHRVEEMFPVHAMELVCIDRKSRAPTGKPNLFFFFCFIINSFTKIKFQFRIWMGNNYRSSHLCIWKC